MPFRSNVPSEVPHKHKVPLVAPALEEQALVVEGVQGCLCRCAALLE